MMSAASSAGGGGYRDRAQWGGCGDTWSAGGGGYGGRGDLHDRARDQWGGGGDGWWRWWGSGDGSHNQPNHIAWRSPTLAAGRWQAQAPLLGAVAPAAAPPQMPPQMPPPPQAPPPQAPPPPPAAPLVPPPPPPVQAPPQMLPEYACAAQGMSPPQAPPPRQESPLAHQSDLSSAAEFAEELDLIRELAAPVGVERLSIKRWDGDGLPKTWLRILLNAQLKTVPVLLTSGAVGCGTSSKTGLITSYYGADGDHARKALIHRSLEFSQLQHGPLGTAVTHAIPNIWPGCKLQTRAIFEMEVEGYANSPDSYKVVALLLGRGEGFGPQQGAATRVSRASDEPANNRPSRCGSRSRSATRMRNNEGNMEVSYGRTQSGQKCLVLSNTGCMPPLIAQQVMQVCNQLFGHECSHWLHEDQEWDKLLRVHYCSMTHGGQYKGLCAGAIGNNTTVTKRAIGIG